MVLYNKSLAALLLDAGSQIFNIKNPMFAGGAKGDGVTDDTVAIQAAIDACVAAGGGRPFAPPGSYLHGPLTVDGNDVMFCGAGMQATKFIFDPSGDSAAFTFAISGQSIWYSGIQDIYFESADTTFQKTMVKVVDGRHFTVKRIGANDGDWIGNDSVGVDVYGREFVFIKKSYIYADIPVRYNANPNLATNTIDHSSINECNLAVSAGETHHAVEFPAGTIVSRYSIRDVATNRGHGIVQIPSTGASVSRGFSILRTRHEQGVVGSHYAIDINANTSELQNLTVDDVDFSGQTNGISIAGVRKFRFDNLGLFRPSGVAINFGAGCARGEVGGYIEAGAVLQGVGGVNGLDFRGTMHGSTQKGNELELVLATGNNHELQIPEPARQYRISGPAGAFAITGMQDVGGGNRTGRTVTIINTTAHNLTIAHNNVGSSVGTRIMIAGGSDLVIPANGAVTLAFVNSTAWHVTGYKA